MRLVPVVFILFSLQLLSFSVFAKDSSLIKKSDIKVIMGDLAPCLSFSIENVKGNKDSTTIEVKKVLLKAISECTKSEYAMITVTIIDSAKNELLSTYLNGSLPSEVGVARRDSYWLVSLPDDLKLPITITFKTKPF